MQTDVNTAIRNAEKAVHDALSDLQHLEMTTKRHLDEQRGTSVSLYLKFSRFMKEREAYPPMSIIFVFQSKFEFPKFTGDRLAAAQRKAKESHQVAQ